MVENISFPDFDLDQGRGFDVSPFGFGAAGDLGGEVSWDAPKENRLVETYHIYFAKVIESTETCNYQVPSVQSCLTRLSGGHATRGDAHQ